MQTTAREFQVLGIGHLAAALRVRLQSQSLSPKADAEHAGPVPHVLIACSDYASAPSFASVRRLAKEHRSSILFAWLSECLINMGPFVVPRETSCFKCNPSQRWDFSLSDGTIRFVPAAEHTANPDSTLRLRAHLGAWLIARELTSLQFGAGVTQPLRVAEIGAPPFPRHGGPWEHRGNHPREP